MRRLMLLTCFVCSCESGLLDPSVHLGEQDGAVANGDLSSPDLMPAEACPGVDICSGLCGKAGCCACSFCKAEPACAPSLGKWEIVASGTTDDLRAVWGSSGSHV